MKNSKNVVVLGGAGDVGEGLVRQLRNAGHRVCVPSRKKEKLEFLESQTNGSGELIGIVGSVSDPDNAKSFAVEIQERLGSIDIIIASLGGWWSGPSLIEMDMPDWHNILQASVTSHLISAQAFLPLIKARPDSQYIFINGGAAIMPVPGSGPISIAAAAQEMMKSVLAKELENDPVSVSALMLLSMIKTRSRQVDQPDWLSADDVGRYIVHMLKVPPSSGETIQLRTPQQVDAIVGETRS